MTSDFFLKNIKILNVVCVVIINIIVLILLKFI